MFELIELINKKEHVECKDKSDEFIKGYETCLKKIEDLIFRCYD